jgi:DNA-directed RNA polymerases I, II, and III subunit RPABC1
MTQKTQTPLISRLYVSRNNLLIQLNERGFDTSKYAGSSVSEISVLHDQKQLDMFLTAPDTNEKVYVKYHQSKSLKKEKIYEYVEDLYEVEQILGKNDQLILLIDSNVNDTIVNEVKQIYNTQKYFITVFNIEQLLFNILEHTLVPKHTILSEQEKKKLYKDYKLVSDSQLPEISRFEPVAKVIGLRPGQVCSILRNSKTAISSYYYRFCY